jgi:hypothetical protein
MKRESFTLYFSSFSLKMEILVFRIWFGILLNPLIERAHRFLDSETTDSSSFSLDWKQRFLNSTKIAAESEVPLLGEESIPGTESGIE